MPRVHTRAYRGTEIVAEHFPIDDVSEYLAQPDLMIWVDMCAPEKMELEALAEELGLHELAIEDALSPHQRPKVDFYDSHLFISCHALEMDATTGSLCETEINVFVNSSWFVTVRKNDAFDVTPVLHRLDRASNLAAHGVNFMLYGLLDIVIDGYFDVANAFDEYYDAVSEGLFADVPLNPSEQRDWFMMRRALVRFHRLVVPMRESISGLMRREHSSVSETMYPYFQDLYDHVLRVTESTEALRDLVATIVETNLSLRDYRQNQVMKKVTSWAAIIAVPTLITGYYGMNVPYPGSGTSIGVAVSGGLVAVLSGALFFVFRKREWL